MPFAIEFVFSLPELAAAEVISQYSTVLFTAPVIVHLSVQPLSPPFGRPFTCMMFRPISGKATYPEGHCLAIVRLSPQSTVL